MTKPWMIVAGAFGLFGLILVARHFRSADRAPSDVSHTAVEALASAPRAQHGWLASEDEHSSQSAGGTRPGQKPSLESSRSAGVADLMARSGSSRDSYPGDASAGLGGTAGLGAESADAAATGPDISVPAAPVMGAGAGLPSHDASKPAAAQGAGSQELVKKADQPAAAAGAEDPNAPVLSVSFDKSTQPDKGDTQPAIDQSVDCNNSGEGCTFNTDSKFAIPDAGNLAGDAGSISFCLQPQWGGSDMTNAGLVNLQTPNVWENHLKIFKNGQYFRFSIWPSSGAESGVSTTINSWQPGQWHPVTVTFGPDPNTGTNMASMYLDGALVGQQPYDGPIDVPQQPLYIGSDMPGGEPTAGGSLKSFQAYNRVLQPDEAANFAANCPQ